MSPQFRILGALEVEADTGPIAVRGRRRRALLGRLVIAPNQPVDADRLAHDVWADAPPPGAASTLASHVSLLRSLLGPERLVHQAGGYQLTVEPGELDADRFEVALRDAQRHARQGSPQRVVDPLAAALGLWRGAALGELGEAAWARGEVARLEELRLGAEELLLNTRLELGQHREIAADAEAAVNDHPLREQRWALLMLALYRSGRQADALRAYQRLRSLLNEQLGVEPSPDVADLEQAIVLQSPDLTWTIPDHRAAAGAFGPPEGAGTLPETAEAPSDQGPAQDGPTVGPGPVAQSRRRALAPVPLVDALRGTGAPFVGRTGDQDTLVRLFAEAATGHRAIALVGGEPGIGKSTLAAATARHVDAAGGAVLYGRCLEVTTVPYQPFVEALDHAVHHAPIELLRDHVAQFGGALTAARPSARHPGP